jgi:hypothetical protein
MNDIFFDLQRQATPALRAGDLAECDRIFSDALRRLPASPFHIVIDLAFMNPPRDVAAHFDTFLRREQTRFEIAAAYTETNGFDINPNRWFFDLFAYDRYGVHDDYDWIAYWQSDPFPSMTLTGMEALQKVYASPAFHKPEYDGATKICNLVVVSRFQQLIHRSAELITELRFPLLATAHDFDFISEVRRID